MCVGEHAITVRYFEINHLVAHPLLKNFDIAVRHFLEIPQIYRYKNIFKG